MRWIIEQPVITKDSMYVSCYLESDPEKNYSVAQTNIPEKEIRMMLDRNLETLARKIATEFLPYDK